MKTTKNNSQIVSEDFGDFLKEELDIEDSFNDTDCIDTSGMPDLEEDEVTMEDRKDKIRQILKNELNSPEFLRDTFIFKIKNIPGEIQGIPLGEFPSSDAFIFKINGQIKKIKLEDITSDLRSNIEESIHEEINLSDANLKTYINEISNHIKIVVSDWEWLIGEEDYRKDLADWLEENQDLWDFKSSMVAEVSTEDMAHQIIEELQSGEDEEE